VGVVIRNSSQLPLGIRAVLTVDNHGSPRKSNTRSDIQLCFSIIFLRNSNDCHQNQWFFHETRWFFEGFEITGTHGSLILIFTNAQNRQFFDSLKNSNTWNRQL
jgi:hypothetical protein